MTELEPFSTPLDLDRISPLPATVTQGERMREWLDLLMKSEHAAKVLARTDFVPKAMRDQPAAVAAAIMRGFELGIDPLDALGSIFVISGRVGYSAEFMRRRIIQAGHNIRVIEVSDARAVIEGRRRGETDWQRASFTADQARRAKIDISAYPADKLFARASSRLCRQVFPDVLSGSVIVEDIEDGLIPAAPVDASPAPPVDAPRIAQRTTRRRAAPRQTTPPPAFEAAPPPLLPGEEEEEAEQTQPQPEPEPSPDARQIADQHEQINPDQMTLGDDKDEPCTRAQQTKLNILLKHEKLDDRDAKLQYLEHQFGRPFTSSKDLSMIEASNLIDYLEEAQSGDDESGGE